MAKNQKNVQKNEFDESIAASVSFFEKNEKKILYTCGIIVVLIVAALLLHQFVITPRNQKADESIFAAQTLFQNGEYEKALNGDSLTMGFLAVAENFKCTKAANLARLYAGICYAETGKYQEAVDMLKSFSGKGDALVTPAALAALGNSYAQLGENEKAAELLVKAAKKADSNTLSPIFLLQAGEIYESLQQKDKALDCYQQIKDNYKQSAQFEEIDKYLQRVGE